MDHSLGLLTTMTHCVSAVFKILFKLMIASTNTKQADEEKISNWMGKNNYFYLFNANL